MKKKLTTLGENYERLFNTKLNKSIVSETYETADQLRKALVDSPIGSKLTGGGYSPWV